MFPDPSNDIPNLLGAITTIVIPVLGVLISTLSQRKNIGGFLRFLLRMFTRVAQDAAERPDPLPNGNGITQQATLLAFTEGSKRVDSVEDDIVTLRDEIKAGFQKFDHAIEEFGERIRIRMDGDLLINSRKHEANAKEISNLRKDVQDIDERLQDLEEWRGAQ